MRALVTVALMLSTASPLFAGNWYDASRTCRVQLDIGANGFARYDKPAGKELNFTDLLASLGKSGTFSVNSIRVVEVNASGSVIDNAVAFQFDEATDYDALSNAKGTLVLMMPGTTASSSTRYYHVYFDVGSFAPPSVGTLIDCDDNVMDEGQSSFRIDAQNAVYCYHKQGAGFSSMDDVDGNDWISYNTGSGSSGEYRGIPNMGYPEGYCHPGKTVSSSSVAHSGPVKITIDSQSNDGKWAVRWEMYPYYATLTVLKVSHDYWFLYEGTPGGLLDVSSTESASDYCVRPGNVKNLVKDDWGGDISGEEWVYFGERPNRGLGRVLYLINHNEADPHEDSFYQMENNMTVFGFGRVLHSTTRRMNAVPNKFTIGFCDSTTYDAVRARIRSAYKPLAITVGTPESSSGKTTRTDIDRETRDHKAGSATDADVRDLIGNYRQDG